MSALFGQLLVDSQRLSHNDLAAALAEQKSNQGAGERIGTILRRLQAIDGKSSAWALSQQSAKPLFNASLLPTLPVASDSLSPGFLKTEKIIPLWISETDIGLAVVDPFNQFALDAVAKATDRALRCYVFSDDEFISAWHRLYGETGDTAQHRTDPAHQIALAEIAPESADDDTAQLRALAADAPVVRLVDDVLASAVAERASDIHFEPFDGRMQVRWRIDGVLFIAHRWPYRTTAAITSRIKILANLDIAERRLPQDGGFRKIIGGREFDIRVSTVPTALGESVVLRLLDQSGTAPDFGTLGLSDLHIEDLSAALTRRQGLVLVCGPTGSGKSTTLYAALQQLDRESQKIVTIEDPIEYRLDGVTQIQVKPDIGLTFANLLRQVVRQDPDIIMIGEIRDVETAMIAVQAAITGHLVLSTLHTGTAIGAVTRLREMGIADYLLSATLSLLIGQRLVRCRCPHCMSEDKEPEAADCPHCHGRRYLGRTGIFETVPVAQNLARLVGAGAGESEIASAAYRGDRRPFSDHGHDKVRAGVTSASEILQFAAIS